MIVLLLLFHPLLSFATFSSAYLFFYIPENSNLMLFSLLLLLLCDNMCPIQFHFLIFIWFSIGFCWVIFHSSSFVILSVHLIFIIHLKHLFTNICNLLVIWLVIFQVSQVYNNNTDFTFVLDICVLIFLIYKTYYDMLWLLNTGYSWTYTPFARIISSTTFNAQFSLFVNNMFVTLLSSTCFEH